MKVNGIEKVIEEGISLEQYLTSEQYVITRVAVELNGDIIPKASYQNIVLSNKDVMEVVHFVGGGC